MRTAEPTFVRSSLRYRSYHDFWRLVVLSGFEAVSPLEVDFGAERTYIWTEANAEFLWALQDHPKETRRAKAILWCLERPDARASTPEKAAAWWKRGLDELLALVDELWVSDRAIEAIDRRVKYVHLGGHPGLREDGGMTVRYDVAHLGQLTPRRVAVLEEIKKRGISVSPNAWDEDRAEILTHARLFLGIERLGGMHVAMPLRWVLGAAYKLPIIQEELPYPDPLVPGESVLTAPLAELPDLVERSLRRDVSAVGEAAWKLYCNDRPFRRGVIEGLREVRHDV